MGRDGAQVAKKIFARVNEIFRSAQKNHLFKFFTTWRVKLQKTVFIIIAWNVHMWTEKSCLPTSTPWRWQWESNCKNILLGIEWNVQVCTENLSLSIFHLNGVGGGRSSCKKNIFCWDIHEMFRCAQKSLYFFSSPPHEGLKMTFLCKNVFLRIAWSVQICSDKSCLPATSLPLFFPFSPMKSWKRFLFCADLNISCNF